MSTLNISLLEYSWRRANVITTTNPDLGQLTVNLYYHSPVYYSLSCVNNCNTFMKNDEMYVCKVKDPYVHTLAPMKMIPSKFCG